MLLPPASPSGFHLPIDPQAERRQITGLLTLVAFLSLAVGLCTSAVAPHAGWTTAAPSIFSSGTTARSVAG